MTLDCYINEVESPEFKIENVLGCISDNISVSLCSDEEEADGLEILMEAPEGFRNSDEECLSESQVIEEPA